MATAMIPGPTLDRLRAAHAAMVQTEQLFRAQAAVAAEMLELDPADPSLQVDLVHGFFTTAEQEAPG
jgi:hypothetical protein